jgi:hypothetical protein
MTGQNLYIKSLKHIPANPVTSWVDMCGILVPVLLSDGLFIAIVYINASLSYRYHLHAQEPQVQLVKAQRISFTCSILFQATNPFFMEILPARR